MKNLICYEIAAGTLEGFSSCYFCIAGKRAGTKVQRFDEFPLIYSFLPFQNAESIRCKQDENALFAIPEFDILVTFSAKVNEFCIEVEMSPNECAY